MLCGTGSGTAAQVTSSWSYLLMAREDSELFSYVSMVQWFILVN